MSSEWQETTLQSLLTFANGKSSPARFDNAKFAVFGSNGLIGKANEFNSPANSIVVGRVGSYCGAVHFSSLACWVTDNAIKATAKDGNDPLFLFYLLKQINLNNWRSGSGQPLINQSTLNSIEVRVPLQSEQRRIGEFVAALDDRISLLCETNATLEAIAQALFKSWFVDFDPVRAKMEGRAPEGMDEATAALFPDSFEESELGLVPKDWRVGSLGEELKIAYGKNLPTTKLLEHGYPVYGGNGRIGFFDKYIYETRQVLIACRGAASGKVNQSSPKAFVTNNSLVLESDFESRLPFGYLKGYMLRSDLSPFVTGSAQPQVTIDNLKVFRMLVPDDSVLRQFEATTSVLEDRIEDNLAQVKLLESLRDTLLPRLISGQLRLPEAESV